MCGLVFSEKGGPIVGVLTCGDQSTRPQCALVPVDERSEESRSKLHSKYYWHEVFLEAVMLIRLAN